MPLTELQLPDKDRFYRDVQSVAGEIKSRMVRWRMMSDFIADLGADDLDAMGVAAGQVRTDLANFRTALDELISLYEGEAVTPTNTPDEVVDAVRRMLVI
jgi:hypothetical protein